MRVITVGLGCPQSVSPVPKPNRIDREVTMLMQVPAAHRNLTDTDLTVATSDIDIRGWTVKDSDGRFIGTIDDLIIDDLHYKVRFLLLALADFLGPGEGISIFPIEGIIRITESDVIIGHPRGHLPEVARYDPDLVVKREFYDELYGPFGNPSQWRTTVSRRSFA